VTVDRVDPFVDEVRRQAARFLGAGESVQAAGWVRQAAGRRTPDEVNRAVMRPSVLGGQLLNDLTFGLAGREAVPSGWFVEGRAGALFGPLGSMAAQLDEVLPAPFDFYYPMVLAMTGARLLLLRGPLEKLSPPLGDRSRSRGLPQVVRVAAILADMGRDMVDVVRGRHSPAEYAQVPELGLAWHCPREWIARGWAETGRANYLTVGFVDGSGLRINVGDPLERQSLAATLPDLPAGSGERR
jgi:hypothetical protein